MDVRVQETTPSKQERGAADWREPASLSALRLISPEKRSVNAKSAAERALSMACPPRFSLPVSARISSIRAVSCAPVPELSFCYRILPCAQSGAAAGSSATGDHAVAQG